jgi:hypothetical protein
MPQEILTGHLRSAFRIALDQGDTLSWAKAHKQRTSAARASHALGSV